MLLTDMITVIYNRLHKMGRRIVVGTIWNVGDGDPSSSPVQNANSRFPIKVD